MSFDIARMVRLIAANDPAAADEVDALAERLKGLARKLRAMKLEDPFGSQGGAADRVKMQVIGPSGILKQNIDTNPYAGD